MGKQIIKISRERDLYMEWSSIVEAPTFFGSRAETAEYLMEAFRPGTDRYTFEAGEVEKRLARADEHGSSAFRPWGCYWDTDGEIYQQQGVLPRARFGEFAEHFLAAGDDVEPSVADLLEPFDDEARTEHG